MDKRMLRSLEHNGMDGHVWLASKSLERFFLERAALAREKRQPEAERLFLQLARKERGWRRHHLAQQRRRKR